MKVVMLAAGIGARLGFTGNEQSAKILLRFGGKSLLHYHIEILQRQGVDELILGVGYHHQDIDREIAALGAQGFVRTVFNENYEEAIRDVLLTSPRDTFTFEDITGMAWIEIDFAADIERANTEILPRIQSPIDNPCKTAIIKQTPDQGENRIQ